MVLLENTAEGTLDMNLAGGKDSIDVLCKFIL